MASLKKEWKTFVILAFLFLGVYLVTRLVNLTALPIFTDEAIYIRWSQIGSRDAAWRFISLVDGKQPMFTWVMMVMLKIIKDPLFAGRFVSVLAGIGSLGGLALVSWELFKSKRVVITTAALYIISPFFLMYDRLAIYDSMVAMFFIWSFYLAVLLVRHLRLDLALILGMVLGGGMLNKSIGFISLYLLPTTLILFDWKGKNLKKRLLTWASLALVAFILSQLLYGILRLSPLFHMIKLKDAVFIHPFSDWITHPFTYLIGNLRGLFDWLINYLTLPLCLVALAPIFVFWKIWREKLLLYVWWIAPFVGLAIFGRVLYPRFILFMTMPLFLLGAYGISHVFERFKFSLWGIVFLSVVLMPSVYMDYFILFQPLYAPIPFSDKTQLIDDWPSGWGIREVNAFFTQEAERGNITVFTDGTFGLLPYAIEIYQVDNPRVKVQAIWPIPEEMPAAMVEAAQRMPTYMIFNQQQGIPPKWSLAAIAEYQKGNRTDVKMRLFRVLPPVGEKAINL